MRPNRTQRLGRFAPLLLCVALTAPFVAFAAPDYGKRALKLDKSIETELLGKWTNPVDRVIVEIDSVDLASGRLEGKVTPVTGPAAADEHELIGWVSDAPMAENVDHVTPITFSTTLYEYGTLPVWGGFLKDGKIVTMNYLVWPNKRYFWDHISTYQETWTKIP